ncbi:MAG: hypothetical protein NC548_39050 [Lachnospiraceae bacterium]|nr:hypothetical protein [Lachnospiraceae bacterium]
MTEEKMKEAKICKNCRHYVIGKRCSADFDLDYVSGAYSLRRCEDVRFGCECKKYDEKPKRSCKPRMKILLEVPEVVECLAIALGISALCILVAVLLVFANGGK